jgi:hypothetical protein
MCLKIDFLHPHLDFLPLNLEAVTDKNDIKFHHEMYHRENSYQGNWNPSILAYYYCLLFSVNCRYRLGEGAIFNLLHLNYNNVIHIYKYTIPNAFKIPHDVTTCAQTEIFHIQIYQNRELHLKKRREIHCFVVLSVTKQIFICINLYNLRIWGLKMPSTVQLMARF